MPRLVAVPYFLALLAAAVPPPGARTEGPAPLRHTLHVALEPGAHRIVVLDTITWSEGAAAPALGELSTRFPGASVERPAARTIVVRYEGTIHDRLEEPGEDYARGFARTDGTIEAQGVFLGASSHWYPASADQRLVVFDMEISLPRGWDAMSQGRRAVHERTDSRTTVRFVSDEPQEEIWLVAGPWVETRREFAGIEALTMLRAPDDGLAAKYLDATGPAIAMYAGLIGRYPYSKFALVENFWETGYGMPSFTLLGSSVIRLPFIVTSSYPHEILHDWWGNGVYVDRARGNWCEGLTAYLADHLFQEQRGAGAGYRQETLQKYADYVARSKDFSLASFHERHSAVTEAVGYGKALMVFHMLRLEMGDDAFVAALRSFYAEWLFRRASWSDLRKAFEKASGRDLRAYFTTWIDGVGAPALRLRGLGAAERGAGWKLSGTIVQTQRGDPFPLSVPLAVTLEGRDDAHTSRVRCDAMSCPFELDLPAKPLRVDVDPEFDLFRKLERDEIPPALSTAFGADGGIVVLPSAAAPELVAAYRAMVSGWSRQDEKPFRVTTDEDAATLPKDAPVWVMGWENKLIPEVRTLLLPYGAALSVAALNLESAMITRHDHAVAVVVRRSDRPELPVAFVAADTPAQVPGLARKLPHYSKYSYVAFEGDEPTNTHKGRWPVIGSPMTAMLDPQAPAGSVPIGKLAPRRALAELPPSFSETRMLATVRTFADPATKGRGLGTPELDAVADTIASAMKQAGLAPGGDSGGFVQAWSERVEPLGRDVAMKNVIGVLRGTKQEWSGQAVVVSAHYDHLGGDHPGADDNASGVAVLLELARAMAASGPPHRTVIFAAFTGEETGLIGSRHFLATWPKDQSIFGAVNLDTVGRLEANKLLVLGCASADEWIHVANGAGYVTGVAVQGVLNDPGGSDQRSFLEAGIPAVQLFTGPHADYHGATDTADKVDGPGLVKVATVAREFVVFLADRDRPLTSHAGGAGAASASPAPSGSERRASLGAIPDYAFPGPGVRITGTMPGSPAELAGLKEGDVIVGLGEAKIALLADLSSALKASAPGDRVAVAVLRDGKRLAVEATLGER